MKPIRGTLITNDIQVKVAWRVNFAENWESKYFEISQNKSLQDGE